jgi:uncharacterized membrane protein
MDELIKKLAPLGVTGIVLVVVFSGSAVAGLAGGAVITAGLAALGPGGMIGGLVTAGVILLITSVIADYGFDAVFLTVLKEQLKTKTKEEIIAEIKSKKIITKRLKTKAIDYITEAEIN